MEYEAIDALREKHAAWRLLRAGNASLILSFLGYYFVEGNRGACGAGELVVVVHSDVVLFGSLVFVDVDPGEEGLVEQAPGVLVCLEVGGVTVTGEVECVGQDCPSLLVGIPGNPLLCRVWPVTLQGMTSIKPEVPVVASCGDLKLRWHARELRGASTLSETAARLGVNRDELSRIERGETVQIRFETIAKLLYGYKCEVSDLFEVLVDAPTDSTPPWAGALAAIQSGRVRAGLPRRPDPDTIEDNVVAADAPGYADALVAVYADDDAGDGNRVRRGAFRPSVRSVAGSK